MKTEQPSGAGAATGSPITLSVDAVIQVGGFIGSKLFRAGESTPYRSIDEVPEQLKSFISDDGDEPDEPQGPPSLSFQTNKVYAVNAEGAILSRAGRRAAAELAGQAYAQRQAEEEAIAAGALDPETQAALEDAHAVDIGLQIKEAEAAQARRDAAYAQAQEAAAREAEPAKAPEFFVKRGAVFMHAAKARLRPGEQVFVKRPSGAWETVGLIDASGSLPPEEMIL